MKTFRPFSFPRPVPSPEATSSVIRHLSWACQALASLPLNHKSKVINHKSPRASRGFTLLEVLIAMFVFSIAVYALTGAFTDTLTTLGTLSVDRTPVEDLRFVRSTVIQEADLSKFEEGGEIETLSCGMATWEAKVEPTTVGDLFNVELSITLTPPEAKAEETYVFHLRILRPTWSQASEKSELLSNNKDRLTTIRNDQGLK